MKELFVGLPLAIDDGPEYLRFMMIRDEPFVNEGSEMKILPTRVGYDLWAELYDQEDNPLILLEERHIEGLAGKVAGMTVADIGCGTGRHAVRFAAAAARVTAVDFSDVML